ncbi:MAG: heat-inducible transcription repressor HrcA [Ignavibacteria bacterium]|nr:heat-inducible transcription repressor HrcA [Ignavibacteria bacterium]
MALQSKTSALTDRQESILRQVVFHFICTATPVGSRYLSKRAGDHLSPATIRNVMADLEELGYLSHPHTSAGRVPTDQGYRYYVDYLMEIERINREELSKMERQLDHATDPNELFRETSRLLSKISKQLSIVSSPHISNGIFEKLELLPISSSKLLVVLSIRSGIVRTIMLEVGIEYRREALEGLSRILNERLSGLTLREIRETFLDRTKDVQDEETGLVRLFVDSVDQLFNEEKTDKVHIAGTQNILEQPEFVDPKNFRSVIELIQDEEFIVHLLQKHEGAEGDYVITIGSENKDSKAEEIGLVSATYNIDGIAGRVGIIGPKRMNYGKIVPLVDHVAKIVARLMAS